MTVKEFINQVFLTEYKKLVHSGFHYISFALMGLGVEFLGACIDRHDFGKRGLSKQRFAQAIRSLFPQKYHAHASSLYDDLRSGFAHQFRPGLKFVLTHRVESVREGTTHLGSFNKQVVLISEDFYEDFERACGQVIAMIDNHSVTHRKLTRAFLKIT
jgi:hypothetical protein